MTEDVKFYLRFSDNENIQIAEPIKFDAANFVLEQREKGLGRDVSFASGTADLRFSPLVNFRGLTHEFERLINEYKTNGFESDVKLIIEIDGVIYVIGQLDFAEAETDLTTYFDCKIIQENIESLIKRRSKVKVDLFSSEDLDGKEIEPLHPTPFFLKATPFRQNSEWTMPFSSYGMGFDSHVSGMNTNHFFNPFVNIEKFGIENTLSPAASTSANLLTDFKIIRAENEITNGKLTIEGLDYYFNFDPLNKFPYAAGSLWYYIGNDFEYGDATMIFTTGNLDINRKNFKFENETFVIDNLTLRRGEYLLLFFQIEAFHQNQTYAFQNYVTGGRVKFEGVSTSISSVIQTVSMYDAMKQVVKSISGLQITAPEFLKTQFITDGLRIRNITDEPFLLSLDDIISQLTEWRADYEVDGDKVFFGLFNDFYTNEKLESFDMLPNEEFKSEFNPEYKVNTLELKYSKYSTDNDEDGSREAVNCELQMMFANRMVENNKAINIGFIRDSFLLESTRKKAIEVNEDVATRDDNSIFIIDSYESDISVNEVLILRHLIDDGNLKLLNDSKFNWRFSGLIEGQEGVILTGKNPGIYKVINIENTVLTLQREGDVPSFQGEGITRIVYRVLSTRLQNRTGQGFESIEGTTAPFSNLRFTPKTVLLKYWSEYLLTANLYKRDKDIKMTKFINNPDLIIDGVREGADIRISGNPKLQPLLYHTQVLCTFERFWKLRDKVRKKRGYIEIVTNEGENVNIYPKLLDFNWESNLLTIEGELKNNVYLQRL